MENLKRIVGGKGVSDTIIIILRTIFGGSDFFLVAISGGWKNFSKKNDENLPVTIKKLHCKVEPYRPREISYHSAKRNQPTPFFIF